MKKNNLTTVATVICFTLGSAFAAQGVDPQTDLFKLPIETHSCVLKVVNEPIHFNRGVIENKDDNFKIKLKTVTQNPSQLAIGRILKIEDGIAHKGNNFPEGYIALIFNRDQSISAIRVGFPFTEWKGITVGEFESIMTNKNGVRNFEVVCTVDPIVNL